MVNWRLIAASGDEKYCSAQEVASQQLVGALQNLDSAEEGKASDFRYLLHTFWKF